MKLRLPLFVFFAFFVAFWAFISCSSDPAECDNCEPGGVASWTGWPFDEADENLSASPKCPDYDKAIEITYNNGDSPEIANPYQEGEASVSKEGENVIVTLSGAATEPNLLVSGTARNGSLKVYGDTNRIVLHLNGVNIKNNSGPAINIQDGKRVTVCLVSGKENYLDGASLKPVPKEQEQAKGAFFSEEKLYFTGDGSLEVKARKGHPEAPGHAIVVDNDFEIVNGKIIISESAGDGIHANYRIEVKGGVIKIASKGDAIQSERDSVIVSGGKILAKTTGVKSHGIVSEGSTSIRENAKVQISVSGNGSKGIKSTQWAEILGGTIKIKTSGNRDHDDADTSTAAGIKVDTYFFIDGGDLTIKSEGDKAKGINVGEDIYMTKGDVDIEADDDGIKVHGTLIMSGGNIKVASRKKLPIDGVVSKTGGTINGD